MVSYLSTHTFPIYSEIVTGRNWNKLKMQAVEIAWANWSDTKLMEDFKNIN